MPDFKPESLDWLGDLSALEAEQQKDPSAKPGQLADALNSHNSMISFLLAIQACFDPAAIEKIRLADIGSPQPQTLISTGLRHSNPAPRLEASAQGYTLSFNSARALSRLNKKVKAEDLSKLVHAALDVTLSLRLTTKQIKALVAWVISGNSASEFDPKAKPIKEDKTNPSTLLAMGQSNHAPQLVASAQVASSASPDLKKLRQLLEKAEAERIQGNKTTEQDKLAAYLRKIFGSSPSKTDKDSLAAEGISETVLLDWLADINVVKKLQSKRKKGKSLRASEWWLLAGHKCLEMVGHGAKLFLKLFKPLFKFAHWVWKRVIEALKDLGVYKYAKAIFTLVMVVAAIWFAWEAFHYGVLRPMEMVWSKVHFTHVAEESPTPVPIPPPTASETVRSLELGNAKLKTSNSSLRTNHSTPIASYQPAVSFNTTASPLNPTATLYDPKILDSEIQSLPANYVVVKDYPMTPDESMPGDVAVSRMQDLIDPDKYTMLIGSGKQTISIANPTHTTLTIYFKSADLFGPLGGSKSPMNFLWEDVMYIHANEIDVETKNPSVIYQCSLVVSGSKYPLTIQCATAADLEHLVSTMQYFIRSSRLAHDTALGGMPYLHQGLVLNDHWVEKLWAGSPMDKAGVRLGDLIWSLDKDTQGPQDAKKMLALLASLAGGNHQLFIYSPADPNNNGVERNEFHTGNFNPKRHKVILTAF